MNKEQKEMFNRCLIGITLSNKEKLRLYKIFARKHNPQQIKIPYMVNSFVRSDECGERRTIVSIFKNHKRAMDYIERNFELEGTWNQTPYDCSGLWYLERADVTVIGDRIIVKQVEYLDV